MRPTTLTALALTLLMLLLVLLAAFFFVFQGQLTLRDELANSSETVDALEADRARLEIEQSKLQATATSIYAAHATVSSEGVALSEQLADTDLQVTRLSQQNATAEAEREVTAATRESYESTGPLVTIVEPQLGSSAIAGNELTLVIVATDVDEVTTVTISIDNELLEIPPIVPSDKVVVRQAWTPEEAGQSIITVTAINSREVTSQPAALTLSIGSPTAQPTETATATATAPPTLVPSPTS